MKEPGTTAYDPISMAIVHIHNIQARVVHIEDCIAIPDSPSQLDELSRNRQSDRIKYWRREDRTGKNCRRLVWQVVTEHRRCRLRGKVRFAVPQRTASLETAKTARHWTTRHEF